MDWEDVIIAALRREIWLIRFGPRIRESLATLIWASGDAILIRSLMNDGVSVASFHHCGMLSMRWMFQAPGMVDPSRLNHDDMGK